jgi:hypothetical protein
MSGFNTLIWETINAWGWWYWSFAIFLSIKNLILLSLLGAPATHLGRAARVAAWIAHIPMLFTPAFNSLGMIALPLMVLANNLLYFQHYLACRDARKNPSPNAAFGARKILQSMVEPTHQ